MIAGRVAWVVGGYIAGTLPSTLVVARARRATGLIAATGRSAGETDPHILMARHLGVGWTALAATLDVLKGFLLMLAARHLGGLDQAWLALVGVAVVLGHSFPFYARQMAGRGLAAASGVFLVLLPVEMVVAGVLILLGAATHNTGLASTVGMGTVPVIAAIEGQPGELVAMAVVIFALLVIRRLEGLGAVVAGGVPMGRALLYRCLFDSSGPPAAGLGSPEEGLPRA